MKNTKQIGNSLGIGSLFLWSASTLFVTWTGDIPGFLLTALTSLGFAFAYFAKWIICKEDFKPYFNLSSQTLLITVLGIGGYFVLYFSALKMAPPLLVNLLNYLWPMLIILFGRFLFRSRELNLFNTIGMMFGFLGAFLIITDGQQVNFDQTYLVGYLLGISAAIIWALYSNLTRLTSFNPNSIAVIFFYIGFITFAAHFLLESPYTPSPNEWIGVLLLIIVNMGYAGWDYAMKKGTVELLASLSYFVPVLSTGLLIIFQDDPLTPVFYKSGFLILTGCIMVNAKLIIQNIKKTTTRS